MLGSATGPLIMAGTSIAGGLIGKKAAEKAGDAQTRALLESLGLQREMWEVGREDIAPWREAGKGALAQFASNLGLQLPEGMAASGVPFTETPGYQFRFDEGRRALDRSGATRGSLLSGEHLKALTRYGQGMAADEYGTNMNRLALLAQLGGSSAGQGAGLATQTGTNLANIMGQAGQAEASGIAGGAGHMTQMFGNLGNIGGQTDWSRLFGGGGGGGISPYAAGAYPYGFG
jgi:hypothetical protein